ncbi:winged helix-turn-helix domain-containing protein [Microbacterium amylolyticum]|uniref:Uncharacterized protein YcaQ n=1 Tax=Microbacterium amylolyticum TaxID=936337 RepID=A0ABS4ZJA3_9MICO|nr:crosslink repair DNA glycosylase YcaQ family protein [Microbacterium amylolyticum]MBP2436561.1 uncharacterized protein YcaQ [Microbacterium amylolyticum]
MVKTRLSAGEARRAGLAGQGIGGPRTGGTTRAMTGAVARMGVLQIDSVNVFARSHYMPLFSRIGAYDRGALDQLLMGRARDPRYVEYVAHEATFLPINDWPLWQFRRDGNRQRYAAEGTWVHENSRVIDSVRAELRDRGPLKPSEIESVARRADRGPWWDWDHAKQALEMMWRFGDVAVARRDGFERVYGLAEQVVPAPLLDQQVSREAAALELVRRASRAYGVSTIADLNDYYRLRSQSLVRAAVDQLVEEGELLPVEVDGWHTTAGRPVPAWLHRDARIPRRVSGATLLTPFDPVVWFRDRAHRMFDFHYRIEIYVPPQKRQYGYYSLPVVVGDRVAARIDLKADRAASTLRVQSAWWEDHAGAQDAELVAAELRRAAEWQGLSDITVSRWGNAADHLAGALAAPRHEHPNA